MKTIAVLTDFSDSAANAGRFAIHMAKKMKAKVLLFNISAVPVFSEPVLAGEPNYLPNGESALEQHAISLKHEHIGRSFPGSYIPEVEFNNESQEIVDVMTSIMQNDEIAMIVTSPANKTDFVTYMLSDACNRIIDWTTVPLLIVPEAAAIKNFEKIAFVSQLHKENLNSISGLGSLMECFCAELMVAHLNENPGDICMREMEKQLNRSLYQKLDCGGVYFRSIPDTAVQKDWSWLKANKRTDLLAIVRQPREQMRKFFKRGQNKHVTYHLTVPVIVLPPLY